MNIEYDREKEEGKTFMLMFDLFLLAFYAAGGDFRRGGARFSGQGHLRMNWTRKEQMIWSDAKLFLSLSCNECIWASYPSFYFLYPHKFMLNLHFLNLLQRPRLVAPKPIRLLENTPFLLKNPLLSWVKLLLAYFPSPHEISLHPHQGVHTLFWSYSLQLGFSKPTLDYSQHPCFTAHPCPFFYFFLFSFPLIFHLFF